MKHFLAAAACAAAMTGAASASTVTIDFVALAALANANPVYGGSTNGDYGDAEGQTFSFGALDVTLSSTANAYLDDLSGGRPAGLGVCSTGITATGQCVVGSDDNVTEGEAVTLTFSGASVLGLSDFVFNDANHNDISDSTDSLGFSLDDSFIVGGGIPVSGLSTFAGLEGDLGTFGIPPLFSLTLSFADLAYDADEFYLSSLTVNLAPVPLPASVLLLGGAVGGLGLMRRRRKAA